MKNDIRKWGEHDFSSLAVPSAGNWFCNDGTVLALTTSCDGLLYQRDAKR